MDIAKLKDRYYGSLAATYDVERVKTPLWEYEQSAIRRALATVAPGSSVIDVPVGTGRFLSVCKELGLNVTGVDASKEMLEQARKKSRAMEMTVGLQQGDIRSLPFPDEAFDVALCVRFLNWLDETDLRLAVQELTRLSRNRIILGLRSYRDLAQVDLRNLRSVKDYLLQIKLRFYQMRTRSEFIYHEAKVVERVFAHCGLRIVKKFHIPTKLPGDYSIYVAERCTAGRPQELDEAS